MKGQPANTLTDRDVRRILQIARRSSNPRRNEVIVLMTVHAGLRACEVARLTWSMVSNSRGTVGATLELPARAAKRGSGRRIPLHRDLRAALDRLAANGERQGPIIRSLRGGPMTPDALVNWFTHVYREAGLSGCSSHSGRRTFVTKAARLVAKTGGSLRDVQILAGHRSIQTTQGYIDGNEAAQRRLVRLL